MKYFHLLIISVTFFLTSCTKESSVENGVTPGSFVPVSGITDSTYLDTITYIDSSGAGIDTLLFKLNYDNRKRVVSILRPLGQGNVLNDFIYYTGNDTLPYLITRIDNFATEYDTTHTYIYYNGAGKIIKDSVVEIKNHTQTPSYFIEDFVTQYTYASGKIFGQTKNTSIFPGPPAVIDYLRDTAVADARGNMINSKKYRLNGINYEFEEGYDFTYDNKYNIYTKSTFAALPSFPGFEIFFKEYSVNNMLTLQHNSGYNVTATYVYNSRGYPASLRYDENGSHIKQIYKYKNL